LAGAAVWSQLRDLNNDGKPELIVLTSEGCLLVFNGDAHGRWGNGPGDSGEDHSATLDTGPNPVWFELILKGTNQHFDVLTRSLANDVRLHKGRAPN